MSVVKLFLNKSFLTHLISAAFIFLSVLLKDTPYQLLLANIGYFALSCAVTNWIAIYMLFERIPFVWGSGVIPARFEAFKSGLKSLIMSEFFTENNIAQVLEQSSLDQQKWLEIADRIDYDRVYQHLKEGLMDSNIGKMLALVGGQSMLDSMREPIKDKLHFAFKDMLAQETLQKALLDVIAHHHSRFIVTIEQIVDRRLDELTPSMVKDIIQKMIREHLGWLVVWGGIFGGLIGGITSFISRG